LKAAGIHTDEFLNAQLKMQWNHLPKNVRKEKKMALKKALYLLKTVYLLRLQSGVFRPN